MRWQKAGPYHPYGPLWSIEYFTNTRWYKIRAEYDKKLTKPYTFHLGQLDYHLMESFKTKLGTNIFYDTVSGNSDPYFCIKTHDKRLLSFFFECFKKATDESNEDFSYPLNEIKEYFALNDVEPYPSIPHWIFENDKHWLYGYRNTQTGQVIQLNILSALETQVCAHKKGPLINASR